MMGITAAQTKCLAALRDYIAEHGEAPSMQALGDEMGTGQSNAYRMVLALEERGYIRRIPRRARAIEIIEHGSPVRLSRQVESLVAQYARENGASIEVSVNELLAEYLAKVSA